MVHIGISGSIASGKSTLAKDLQKLAHKRGYVAEIIPFASGIREIMTLENTPYRSEAITHKLYDWGYPLVKARNVAEQIDASMTKFPSQPGIKNRRLLQILGTEVGRDMLDKDAWIIRTQQLIRGYEAIDFAISDDLRFNNEAYAVDVHIAITIRTEIQCMLYVERKAQLGDAYTFADHASEKSLTAPALLEVPIGFTSREVMSLFTQLDYIRRLRY